VQYKLFVLSVSCVLHCRLDEEGRIAIGDELGCVKAAVHGILTHHSPGGTKENNEKPR
jgi:hypothetical protein